ncbi:MAG TPA: hypothetical protein PL033_00575 [Candidatus Brocadiia bacterium]|nr:hypothetical protein [Candidatus Brocadiia bacterium]
MSFFEITMLICFGAAWPFSILKSYRSRRTAGKSVQFLFIVLIGYIAGVLHKITHSYDIVTALYCINGTMVMMDIGLYFRNRRIESHEAALHQTDISY